jgi:hypothetical protein
MKSVILCATVACVLFALGMAHPDVEAVHANMLSTDTQRQKAFLAELAVSFGATAHLRGADKSALATASYSQTGFVYVNYFSGVSGLPPQDNNCSMQTSALIMPVNYCLVSGNYAMKFQLTQSKLFPPFRTEIAELTRPADTTDSCTGGIVQYFTDTACTTFAGTSSLEGYGTCSAVGNNPEVPASTLRTVTCSTAAEALIDDTFVYKEYVHRGMPGVV